MSPNCTLWWCLVVMIAGCGPLRPCHSIIPATTAVSGPRRGTSLNFRRYVPLEGPLFEQNVRAKGVKIPENSVQRVYKSKKISYKGWLFLKDVKK